MNTDAVKARLSSAVGDRSENANVHLAREIATNNDVESVESLVSLLQTGTAAVKPNCIKTLYEIGALEPKLISLHKDVFLNHLKSKNNRLQWGAMTAIASFAALERQWIHQNLPNIMDACDKGSVITRDNTVQVLLSLAGSRTYYGDAVQLLFEILMKSPVNQLPMYAERMSVIVNKNNNVEFISILTSRLTEIEKEGGRKRIKKVIDKLK